MHLAIASPFEVWPGVERVRDCEQSDSRASVNARTPPMSGGRDPTSTVLRAELTDSAYSGGRLSTLQASSCGFGTDDIRYASKGT